MPYPPMIDSNDSIRVYGNELTGTSVSAASDSPFKNFIFPLNVYAYAIQLQEGKVQYLHYGLFQNDKTSLQAAQQFSTDLLIKKLPPPPCRVLEVGIGLGTTLSLLSRMGYHIHGITPDSQQIAFVRKFLRDATVSVSNDSLESFTDDPESFDFLFFQESAQYIDPIVIFNKALDLLSVSGDLLIIDEFALKSEQKSVAKLHLLKTVLALAERFGFELVEQLDLTAMAAPTLDYLLHLTQTHRHRLMNDLALTEEQLILLDRSNYDYRNRYISGYYGYALLHFRKKTYPKWRVQILGREYEKDISDLFGRVFHQTMGPSFWQWKYGSDLNREIGVWREGRLIGHYGGMARSILFFGQPETAVQIGDVMVDAAERGVLTRKGPFFLMAATFLECYIGYGKPYLIGFGFPNDRAMKVAEHLGLYTEVGRMVECGWNTRSRFPLFGSRVLTITNMPSKLSIAHVNECWQRMAADLKTAIVGVRDWAYLQHRYLNHPNHQYQIFLVKNRFSGYVRGILVLHYTAEGCEIMDMISPLAEIPLLVTHARRLAGMQGVQRVFCRITENFVSCFASTGGESKPLNIRIPANNWSDGPMPGQLKDHWWLTSGDKDFR